LVKPFNPGVLPPSPNVPGETLLAIPPINKTVMEGASVAFDCVTKNNKSTIAWYREGLEIMKQKVRFYQLYTFYPRPRNFNCEDFFGL
jgi:hypothetical protein